MPSPKPAGASGAGKPKPKGTGARRAPRAARTQKPALPAALVGRITQSEGTTADAILLAAGELFTTRGPSQVSLREVAERAGVNYGLIHHYFGTKEALLSELMRHFTSYGTTFITDDAIESTAQLFDADSGNFAEMLAWSVLDGASPHNVFGDTSSVARFTEVIEQHWQREGARLDEAPFDSRLVAGFVILNILVWDFYAPYIRVLASLEDRDLPDLHDDVRSLLQHLVGALAPATPGSGEDGVSRPVTKRRAAATRKSRAQEQRPAKP